jgi:hypothetical protein
MWVQFPDGKRRDVPDRAAEMLVEEGLAVYVEEAEGEPSMEVIASYNDDPTSAYEEQGHVYDAAKQEADAPEVIVLDDLKAAELRDMCRESGLKVGGNKAALVARLVDYAASPNED